MSVPNNEQIAHSPSSRNGISSRVPVTVPMILGLIVCAFLMGTVSLLHADEFTFITTTDYSTGSSSTISLDGSYTATNNVASVHSDAVCRYYRGLVYVVNRFGGDNIQILDPDNNFQTVRQFSVGIGSNPVDIAFASENKAYVSRYDSTRIWIVDPSTGTHTGSIDLASLADTDGLPEMDQMCVYGDHLFITIQRLDRDMYWGPSGTSYIAVIDMTADTLLDTDLVTPGIQPIMLTGTNPGSSLQLDPYSGNLYVSCVGFWGLQDGGVEMIDPDTFLSQGFILSEAAAGGDVNDVELTSAEKGHIIISDASFHNVLKSFNSQTGVVTGTLYAPGDYVLQDIELSPLGELYLADRTPTNPGIRIYDALADSLITSSPIDVGLPPFDITFSVNTPSSVDRPRQFRIALGQNYPNPFNPSTTIPFTLSNEGFVLMEIFDVAGRLVRTLLKETRPAGEQQAQWNGRDDLMSEVPSGFYFVKLMAKGSVASRKVLLLK